MKKINYYNENFENITKKIKQGNTVIFKESSEQSLYSCWDSAKEYAKEKRSYCYKLYVYVRYDITNAEIRHVGYGVPK